MVNVIVVEPAQVRFNVQGLLPNTSDLLISPGDVLVTAETSVAKQEANKEVRQASILSTFQQGAAPQV